MLTDTTEIYDIPTQTWSPGPAIPRSQAWHCLFSMDEEGDEYFMVAGEGRLYNPFTNNNGQSHFTWHYSFTTGDWTQKANLNQKRIKQACHKHTTPDGKVVLIVAGGFIWSSTILSHAERYDVEANEWSELPNLPLPVVDPAMHSIRDKVYLFGGCSAQCGQSTCSDCVGHTAVYQINADLTGHWETSEFTFPNPAENVQYVQEIDF